VSSASFSGLGAEIGPRAPTVVVDLIGSEESLGWGRAVLAPGGRQVLLTTFPSDHFPLQPRELVFAELTVIGSRYATRAEVAVAAGLVHDGSVRPVVGRVVRPDGALIIHEELRSQSVVGRGAIDWRE
jgi:D-arabinose 1-dehydrogenase-like Zn-dependent alcohol dehydrogenase